MAARRRPSGDSPDERGSKVENGFYRIVDVPGEEREFDWVPKNPSVDPPTGQYRLSESAREAYSWCVDYIDDQTQETYDGFLGRLREIVFGGLVAEPIGPDAAKRMNELRADLLSYAKRKLGPIKTKAVELRIRIAIVLYLAGLALAWAGAFPSSCL